jgi:glutathionylspermidine amidase/synthetase
VPGKERPVSFGTALGVATGGVASYSSDYDSADDNEYPDRHSYRSYLDDVYLGYKWQCVEFARRWLYLNRGYVFDDVAMAYEIFQLTDVVEIPGGRRLPLHSFANGSKRWPEPGCLLIWNEGGEFSRTGHVAIVSEVFPDRVRVAEQNFHHQLWPDGQDYAREIEARTTPDGEYWIRTSTGEGRIRGWVIQTGESQHAEPRPEFAPRLLTIGMGKVELTEEHGRSWLNVANPLEAAYVEMMSGALLSSRPEDQDRYLRISHAAAERLRRMTNELHAMFLHATDHVLQDEALMAKFGIPASVWPKIHESWNNRRNQMITGRLDFAVTPEGIKVYEYNADSASCHTETGLIQGRWAGHVGLEEGSDPGETLIAGLVEAWRNSDARGVVHILTDDSDAEERYHALFMQQAMEKAGLECKVLRSLDGLHWADDGNMLDADGVPILWVWKTWAWETALDQIRAECDDDEVRLREYDPGRRKDRPPRLVDVLLRKNVMVFEPLWTLLPSNKAILPVLWALFPNHPALLRSIFVLDEELQAQGYVIKPIVGRCGANITLIDQDENVLHETGGQFEHRDQIYQELYPLPNVDGIHVQLCTFTAGGVFAGICSRTDYSRVIDNESDVIAVRVVADREL